MDPGLREKIARGEFVDLERLLTKSFKTTDGTQKLELVTKDGSTFFSPVIDRGSKITNVHKWEQAFGVYAAIYFKANPGRQLRYGNMYMSLIQQQVLLSGTM